eukprot:COSAG06_NODE_2639_length_6532_cov_2.597388_5_plen_38_part_01
MCMFLMGKRTGWLNAGWELLYPIMLLSIFDIRHAQRDG